MKKKSIQELKENESTWKGIIKHTSEATEPAYIEICWDLCGAT